MADDSRKPAVRRSAGSDDERANAAWQRFLDVMLANKEQFAAALAEFDLNTPQAFLLRALAPGAAVPMCRFASALGCDASNVTNLVDRLETRGLIERQSDPSDRRVRNIALTRTGARLRQQLLQRAFAPPQFLSRLTPAELTQLDELLTKALAGVDGSGDCEESQ